MLTSASLPEAETRLWYEDKVRRFGYDHRGLGFRTRSSQEKRFEALLAAGDFAAALATCSRSSSSAASARSTPASTSARR